MKEHPQFTMSMFAKKEDLLKAKATYYQDRTEEFETVLSIILEAHELSCVDWPAMRRAKKLLAN